MRDVDLVTIWQEVKKKNSYVEFHEHKCHELVYYSSAMGKTKVGKETYMFSDGSYVIIPPHVPHDDYHVGNSEIICLLFSGQVELPQLFCRDPLGRIHSILKDLLSEIKNQRYGYKEMIEAKLNELCLYIMRNEKPAADEKNFEYIINYIKENHHEKLRLSECADYLNLSYDYFQHKFKEITGISPRQYLISERLISSEKMLMGGKLSCTEIAYRCGFSTSAQFSAMFKRKHGMTPLKFRKTNGISNG